MTLPLLRVLEQTVSMAEVQATGAFVELGVADELGHGPATAGQLADGLGVVEDRLERLLAFLATRGIVTRTGDRYALTAAGDLLRSGHPDSIRDWVLFQSSAWQWHAWERLADGIRDTATPFAQAHGRTFFDFLGDHEEAGTRFDAAMRSTSRLQAQLLSRVLDLGGVDVLCDVGGGTGSVLATLLEGSPSTRGMLAELTPVLERAEEVLARHGVADRVELMPTDMFASVPPGADRYLLSAVIHDWDDNEAVAILANVRSAMAPSARAWIVELELPPHDGASLERAYDLLMLTLGGGRERTRAQFTTLYAAAGLAIADDHVLANGWHVHELVAN